MYDPRIRAAYEAAMALPRWRRGWAMMRSCSAVLLRHSRQVALVCVAICLVLSLFRSGVPLWRQLVYSLPMGMITWALIDGGRFFVDQDSPHLFPRGWRGAALIIGGVFAGFIFGTLIGDAINGQASFGLMRRSPEFFAYIFLFSMASGIGISLFFYSQGKSAYFRAEIEIKSRQATEAQLKLLQSQLDPHMLFNTLANLRALIPQEPERAVRMLDQLVDFLRATLSASRTPEHSLQAEFARLADYLALMQIRMGARLAYRLDLPAHLAQAQVPSLILQSLVENALLHGLDPQLAGGTVSVSAAQEGSHLLLQVQDDGAGCEPAALHEGFGLTQVRERLASRYGSQATIKFIANSVDPASENSAFFLQKGCAVQLRLPLSP
jgi:Histidine kinase